MLLSRFVNHSLPPCAYTYRINRGQCKSEVPSKQHLGRDTETLGIRVQHARAKAWSGGEQFMCLMCKRLLEGRKTPQKGIAPSQRTARMSCTENPDVYRLSVAAAISLGRRLYLLLRRLLHASYSCWSTLARTVLQAFSSWSVTTCYEKTLPVL
jgi:hypothetical protein